MKSSTPLPAFSTSRSWYFPIRDTTPLPAICHLAMERECHTVDLLSCQRGRVDLTDFVTSLFIVLFCFIYNNKAKRNLFVCLLAYLSGMAGPALYGMAPCFGHTGVPFNAENDMPSPGSLRGHFEVTRGRFFLY